MITTTEVEWKALPAQRCPVAGARQLLGDRSILVVRLVPVVGRLAQQGRRR